MWTITSPAPKPDRGHGEHGMNGEPGMNSQVRQQVLFLWTDESPMDSPVIAWSFHDGSNGTGPELPAGKPPYDTAALALSDGWFLLQATSPSSSAATTDTGEFRFQFVFERTVSS